MDLAFVRSAFSPVIAEALDRSDGIYHRDSGELIAQGELGLPVFVGTMQFTVQAVIERVNRLKIALHPGDVFIVNDPYLGGTHLMDVKFVQPFFRDGRLWCWLANTGHWPDTGGMVPGGFSANATEVEQEGLRLPPVKLYKQGVLDDEILSIILSNIRIADQRIGDIKAQAAALATGAGAAGGAARPLRRRDRRRGHRRAEAAGGAADAREDRDHSRRRLRGRGLRRFRRRRRRAAADRHAHHQDRRQRRRRGRAVVRHERLVAAVQGADEQRHRDDALVDLPRGQARLSGSGDQRRHLRAAAHRRSRRHVPLRALSAAGLGLRRRGEPAHRRGGVRRARQGDPRPAVRRAGRHQRQPRRRRLRPAEEPRLRDVRDLRRRLRRQPVGRRHLERLLDDRHLEDDADRDHGAALPGAVRGVLAARRLGRRRRAPRRLRRQLPDPPAPRRRPRLDGDGPRPRRPAGRAGRRRRRHQHRRDHPRRRRPTCRRISRRTRTSRSTPAT